MCTLLDGQVGRMVEALRERGELDDTLILFMSDHGDMDGDHHMVSKQHSFYEEVMRLPVILHWPAGLRGGRRVDGLVEAVDLLPTLCELAGRARAVAGAGAQHCRAAAGRWRRRDAGGRAGHARRAGASALRHAAHARD